MVRSVRFLEAVADITGGNVKILQSDFRHQGQLPVVDQGRELVAGYTNRTDIAVKSNGPVIVFGDHTRALKYIDFPFALGADGVKVLRPRAGFDPKFVYHFLRSLHIPSAGYSRHFKFLKEKSVPKPALSEQRRIAAILDYADALRAKRHQVLARLDALNGSMFHAMFGSPSRVLTRKLGEFGEWRSGGTPPRGSAHYFGGSIPWYSSGELGSLFVSESAEHLTDLAFAETSAKPVQPGSLLIGMYDTAALKSSITTVPSACNQAVAFCRPIDTLADPVFLYFAVQSVRRRVLALRRGIRQKNLNLTMVREIEVPAPPLDRQREFSARVAGVSRVHSSLRVSINAVDELFLSLQAHAFRGEL